MEKSKRDPDKWAQILGSAIEGSGVAQVIRSTPGAGSVNVLFRVFEKRIWLGILEYALSRADGWNAHVCQQYFMRGGGLVYGWNFILRADDIQSAVQQVSLHLTKAADVVPRTSGSLDSYPLVGASPRRTAKIKFDPRLPGPSKGGPSHKGAYTISGEG